MDVDELRSLVRKHLDGYEKQPGTVLYSGIDTIRKGDFYLMGLNPGGNEPGESIIDTVGNRSNWSAYTHNCWKCKIGGTCDHVDELGALKPKVMAPHQTRVTNLVRLLCAQSAESILATNAIFLRTENARLIPNLLGWWNRCWEVHQALLHIVRPRWIVCLGKGYTLSSFALLHEKAGYQPKIKACRDDGRFDGRYFEAEYELDKGPPLAVKVLGIPHPSRVPFKPELGLGEFIAQNVAGNSF